MLKYNWDDVVKAFHAGLTVEAIGKEYYVPWFSS